MEKLLAFYDGYEFVCPICGERVPAFTVSKTGRQFICFRKVMTHLNKHYVQALIEKRDKRYRCELCGYESPLKSDVYFHILTEHWRFIAKNELWNKLVYCAKRGFRRKFMQLVWDNLDKIKVLGIKLSDLFATKKYIDIYYENGKIEIIQRAAWIVGYVPQAHLVLENGSLILKRF